MVIDNAAGITQNLGSPKGGELLGGLFAPCTSFGPVLKLMNAADFESVTVGSLKWGASRWSRNGA
jgi:hypothetical protein